MTQKCWSAERLMEVRRAVGLFCAFISSLWLPASSSAQGAVMPVMSEPAWGPGVCTRESVAGSRHRSRIHVDKWFYLLPSAEGRTGLRLILNLAAKGLCEVIGQCNAS